MALSKCPECGGDVSTSAATCPHCGHPLQTIAQVPSKPKATRISTGMGCLIIIGFFFLIYAVSSIGTSCEEGCRERETQNRQNAEQQRKISIPEITKYICEIDGVGESKPQTQKTIMVLPESAEGQAGKIEIVNKVGFCERHRNETVKLIRRQNIVCPKCSSDSVEKNLGTETIIRADLPEGYQTDDHQTYRILETVEDKSVCRSRTCKCIAGGATEKDCRGNWKVEINQNPMDDTKTVLVYVEAVAPYRDWLGQRHTPKLILRCESRKTEMIIHNGGPAEPELGRYERVTVSMRYDDAPAKKLIASESTTNEALFIPNATSNIKRMLESDLLFYQFTPFQSGDATVLFDLRGLDQHIGKLRQECRW